MGDNGAILAGFTRELNIIMGSYDLHVFVRPETDLDDRFKAWDADECEWLFINGWLIDDVEEVATYA